MIPPVRGTLVYVDMDGTLIDGNGVPNTKLISYLKTLKNAGVQLVCWSSGGREYAKRCMETIYEVELFDDYKNKPDYVIDDLEDLGIIRVNPYRIGKE